jgi:hypothetical protein
MPMKFIVITISDIYITAEVHSAIYGLASDVQNLYAKTAVYRLVSRILGVRCSEIGYQI